MDHLLEPQSLLCFACFQEHLLAYELLLSSNPISPPLFFPSPPEGCQSSSLENHTVMSSNVMQLMVSKQLSVGAATDWQVYRWGRSSFSLRKAAFPILFRGHFKLLQLPLTPHPIP